jgi:Uma2 family endonuclease
LIDLKEPYAMAIASPPQAERVTRSPRILLSNVPWSTYRSLVEDPDNRHVRMTYDRGSLELMSPSFPHEKYNYRLRRMIDSLTEILNIPIIGAGSTTFKREDLERGLEPDTCYYLGNERRIRGKNNLDLTIDPPPDLAIEVDITSSSLDRAGIYAALGVPEIWRFDGESLRVYQLQRDGTYTQLTSSPIFPFLPLEALVRFATQGEATDDTTWGRSFRAWVQAEIAPHLPRPEEGAGPA